MTILIVSLLALVILLAILFVRSYYLYVEADEDRYNLIGRAMVELSSTFLSSNPTFDRSDFKEVLDSHWLSNDISYHCVMTDRKGSDKKMLEGVVICTHDTTGLAILIGKNLLRVCKDYESATDVCSEMRRKGIIDIVSVLCRDSYGNPIGKGDIVLVNDTDVSIAVGTVVDYHVDKKGREYVIVMDEKSSDTFMVKKSNVKKYI